LLAPPRRGERSLDVLGPEPAKTVAMLDRHDLDLPVGEQAAQPAPMAVQAGPEPPISTRTIGNPNPAAACLSPATCRSRSARSSSEETRASIPILRTPLGVSASELTRIVRLPTRTAGTGNLPSRDQWATA